MPKISVIIPAYNAEKTILETIQSIQNQTFQDFEIIVINDGSSDKTLEVLQSVCDQRIRVFSYENGGLPVARNRGIVHAIGEYLSFLDADDLWTNDKLELQLNALEKNNKAGAAYSWHTCMFENGNITSYVRGAPTQLEGNVYSRLLLHNFIGNGSNILVRKKAIDSVGFFESSLRSCEDWDFYIRLAKDWSFVTVPEYQIIYRKAPGSMTTKAAIMEQEGLRVIERAFSVAPKENQHLKQQSLAYLYLYCADLYLTNAIDKCDIFRAQRKLVSAVYCFPPILLNKDFQRFSLKSILKQLIPSYLLLYLTEKYKNITFAHSTDSQ